MRMMQESSCFKHKLRSGACMRNQPEACHVMSCCCLGNCGAVWVLHTAWHLSDAADCLPLLHLPSISTPMLWASQYVTWLLNKLTLKGVFFLVLFKSHAV